jgi:Fe-S cluster biogenesis protein NfuA/nitrite reductase/ring-hydroxylating ferredoxin subunit
MEDREARARVERIEGLLAEVEALEEPARSLARETVQALLELYGEGLSRIVERGGVGDDLVADGVVSHLLLVHDLHPVGVEARVRQALEVVRPYLASHGGDVELLGIEEGVARLRLQGSCNGCPSSAMTLRLAIEDAIQNAAPELERIEAEGATEPQPAIVQLGSFVRAEEPAPQTPWQVIGALPQLSGGGSLVQEVRGERVLFLKADETLYAYRDHCPACSGSLEGGVLEAGELECAECGRHYDARRAGRSLDSPQLSLEPVPLLVDAAGLVQVALPAAVA